MIPDIITYLLPFVSSKLGDRVYRGIPEIQPNDIYCTIMSQGLTEFTKVETRERLRFMIHGKKGTTYQELSEIDHTIFEALQNYKGNGVYKAINGNRIEDYNTSGNKVILRDILIHYTK